MFLLFVYKIRHYFKVTHLGHQVINVFHLILLVRRKEWLLMLIVFLLRVLIICVINLPLMFFID